LLRCTLRAGGAFVRYHATVIRCSHRLAWDAAPNAHALLLDELRGAGARLIDLTISNPTRAGIPYPDDAIARALADPRAARYEPSPQGLREARGAIAARYAEAGLAVDADDLVLTASTSEAYALVFKLLCDPGDCVLVPQPSYPLFDYLAALEAVRAVPYRLGFDGRFFLDLAALQHALDLAGDRARAILLVSPNNPTGGFLHEAEREGLAALAAERGLALVSDEVFGDYAFDELRGAALRRGAWLGGDPSATCFTLDGISKSLGLPQLKLGWIHVGGPAADRAALRARLELVADTYLSVGAPVQLALPSLLGLRGTIGGAIRGRCRRNLAALQQATRGSAASVLPAEGGWYACVRLPATRSDEAWALELLAEDGVVVQPGYFYDFPESLCVAVVSLLPDEVAFADAAARITRRAGG
jgi:aspartate/methionine/tyrosine aminotransferase